MTVEMHECPVCRRRSASHHCEDRGCPWLVCRALGCQAVVSKVTRRLLRRPA